MGDIASNPGSLVLKLRKLVGILALLCLYCLPIALLRQWLLRIQASFTEDYSCRYSSGFAPDSLTSAGGYAFPIANSGSKDKDFYTLFCLLFLIILVFLYLCPPNRFRTDVSAVRIKREPGVNPGQAPLLWASLQRPDNASATVVYTSDGKASGLEQVRRPAIQAIVCAFADSEPDTCTYILLYC